MKLKFSWIAFLLSLILLIPAKLYIASTGEEFLIGHLRSRPLCLIFMLVAIVLVLAIVVMAFCSKNVPERLDMPKDIFCGVFSAIAGVAMMVFGITNFKFLSEGLDFRIIAHSFSAILSGVAFMFISNLHFTGKSIFKSMPLLSLFPTIWAGVRLLVLFLKHSSMVEGKVDMFEMFSSMFLLVFFFAQSRLISDIQGRGLVNRIFAYGMCSILALISYNLPVMIYNMKSLSEFSFMYAVDICLLAYIFVLMIRLTPLSYIEYKMYGNREE